MRRRWTIYTVTFFKAGHRLDGTVRYIGQTQKPLSVRWGNHVAKATAGAQTALGACIRKYGPDSFVIEALSMHDTRSAALAAEIAAISRLGTLTSDGRGGLNLTPGGDAVDFSNPAVRAKHKAAATDANRRPHRRTQSAGQMKKTRQAKAAIFSQTAKENWADPDIRHRMLDRRTHTAIAAIGRANAERHKDPVFREQHRKIARLGGLASRPATVARNKDPAFIEGQRARLAEIRSSPEFKAKVRAGQMRRRAREARERGDDDAARTYEARAATFMQPSSANTGDGSRS